MSMTFIIAICSPGVIGRLGGSVFWWHLFDLFAFSLHISSNVNKDLGLKVKAKAKAKDLSHKAKAKAKD